MYTGVKHNGFIKGKLIIYTSSMQKELIKIYAVLSDCCLLSQFMMTIICLKGKNKEVERRAERIHIWPY